VSPGRVIAAVVVRTVIATVIAATVVVVAAGSTRPAIAAPCWRPPVDGAGTTIVDPFRAPTCRWCAGNRGIEYRVRPATVVRAAATGVVSFSGLVAGTRYVVVELASGWRLTYGDVVSSRLRAGDRVVAGSRIATASGRLHFGVRTAGGYVDPAPYLARAEGRRRLVPVDGRAPRPAPPPRWSCGGRTGGGDAGDR
jgi:murein DD-endopeptidase MepM/ murein hydrolase activator NlpD